MTRRSQKQRFLMLAASTAVVAGGVLLPTSAFAATPETPQVGSVTTMGAGHGGHSHHDIAKPAVKWVKTTDSPSGITVKLPGKATLQKLSAPAGGTTVTGRVYSVKTDDGLVGFVVLDVPDGQEYLNDGLQGFLEGYNEASRDTLTSTSSQKTTVDGRPALDARLSTKGSDRKVGAARFIADDTHIVQAVTLGSAANEKDMDQIHRQILASIRIP
ncbi:hypothetical protein SM007_34095 [Streptomyces avermitilis]|nr:hypothetical protein [Streptomyces avermitilis]OOV21394.1 hypothetical protein SM007_34095 [Streptomyces avermitilis]